MKIVNYKSGLGNQLFYYLFTLYLEEEFPNETIYGYYHKKFLLKHNGLEIQKVFDVKLPKSTWYSSLVAWLCRKLTGIGIPHLKATDKNFDKRALYYDGWWQDKRFMKDSYKLKYRDFELDDTNETILKSIKNEYSISIHVRRGDYLLPQFVKQYENIATIEYYKKAIEIVANDCQKENVMFFVFSDDINWVKENLQLKNAIYVENNRGENSYLDMYLMSHCKVNILANSSFSYWGAMLNENTEHTVVYPSKWNNYETPDIFPNEWIGL